MLQRRHFEIVAGIRDEGTGEVECFALLVHDDLDRGRIIVFVFVERRGDSRHIQLRMVDEILRQTIDHIWVDQRFIALYIDDDLIVRRMGSHFCQTIGACRMEGGGHHDMTAEALHFLFNVFMVCRNDDDVRELGLNGSFIDTMHQCLSRDQAEGLPRKTCRCIPGRNDTSNFHDELLCVVTSDRDHG